jgi:hypothetical protein
MKSLYWVGAVLIVLGVLSLIIPIPHQDREGISVGNVSVGVQTQHSERVPPLISAVLILGGAGLVGFGSMARRS